MECLSFFVFFFYIAIFQRFFENDVRLEVLFQDFLNEIDRDFVFGLRLFGVEIFVVFQVFLVLNNNFGKYYVIKLKIGVVLGFF